MKEIIEDTGFRQGFLFKLVIENVDLSIGLQKVLKYVHSFVLPPSTPRQTTCTSLQLLSP